jgi:hypothetical protein
MQPIPGIPNLLNKRYVALLDTTQSPPISVIVSARNEAESVSAGLRSLR